MEIAVLTSYVHGAAKHTHGPYTHNGCKCSPLTCPPSNDWYLSNSTTRYKLLVRAGAVVRVRVRVTHPGNKLSPVKLSRRVWYGGGGGGGGGEGPGFS